MSIATTGPMTGLSRVVHRLRAVRDQRLALYRSGARLLLEDLEWESEKMIHLARGFTAMAAMSLLALVWQASAALLLFTTVPVLIAWLVVWRFLRRRSPSWRWLRYVLILVDTLLLVRFALIVRTGLFQVVDLGNFQSLPPQALANALPPIFVLLAISGALRLAVPAALFAGAAALLGQLAVTLILGIPLQEMLPQFFVLALTVFLGGQLVWHLRQVALRAAEGRVLQRYVPEGLTQELAQAGGAQAIARLAPVTILILDIRGFTSFSEPLGPAQAVGLLNDFFGAVVGPLAAQQAVLDKYLGDGLLAFVEGPDHAARGVRPHWVCSPRSMI